VILLVTGALGHVGRAVALRAAAQGFDVIATHRGGRPGAEDQHAHIRWERCDLDDPIAVEALVERHAITACIHAAAVSNEAYARPHPLAAIRTNIGATAHLLDCARTHGWQRFVFVSTGSVFQLRRDATSPIPEDAPVAPGNVYGTTKANAEALVTMFRTQYDVSAATVRLSWVFGPPVVSESPARGPIPSYVVRALRGEAVRERGAEFEAGFTYIDDVADGLIATASARMLRHDVYHLSHGRNFTAGAVAEAVRAACPGAVFELGPGTEPWTKYTALRGPLAAGRLRDDIGFTPSLSLEEAVWRYVGWMRSRIAA